MRKLTPKQRIFCKAYLASYEGFRFNGTRAAMEAGCKKKPRE